MKADHETYAVRIGRRKGKRYAERVPLNLPWDAARGRYELLSNLALRELINDLTAESDRRGVAVAVVTYDPLRSQIRKPS